MAMKELTSPESQQSIDKVDVTECFADVQKKMLRLVVSKGYDDGQGNLVIIKQIPVVIAGDDYDVIWDAMGDPAKELKVSVMEGIWAYLTAQGIVDIS